MVSPQAASRELILAANVTDVRAQARRGVAFRFPNILPDSAQRDRVDWKSHRYFPGEILVVYELAITESVIEAIIERVSDTKVTRVIQRPR